MFHFVNTITKSKQSFEPDEFDKWEKRIITDAIKEDASVVDFYTLQRPLGESRLLNPFRYVSFGKNLKLQHQYFVVWLKKKDGEECFLSLDKALDGITAQYGLTYESVANKFKGDYRYKPLPDLKRSFNPFKFVILLDVRTVLRNLKSIVKYNLWHCNCQKLTQELADLLSDYDEIKLYVPGSDKKVGLNDESLLSFVESMYPSWKERNEDDFYELTRIPKVGDITIHSGDPGVIASVQDKETGVLVKDAAKKNDYDSLVDRQKFYNHVCNNKKVMGTKGLLKNERHVIMRNLKPNNYKKVMEELNKEATAENNKNKIYAIEMVSSIWKDVFDILVITEKRGVVLFQFADKGLKDDKEDKKSKDKKDKDEKKKDEKEKDKEEIKLKAQMLQKLGDFGENTFLTTILVNMQASKDNSGEPNPENVPYGHHFDLSVSTAKPEDIDDKVTAIFAKIEEKIIKEKKLENKLNMLVGKIFLLQNLEDKHHLLHHRVTSQEWGRPGVMLWTPKQWECIEMAKNAFRQESSEKNYFRPESRKKLKLVVRGCQGSGKTLLLMRIAREFVATNKNKKVLVFIDRKYKMLIDHLSDIIESDTTLCGRIIINHLYGSLYDYGLFYNTCEDIGLVLEDEAKPCDLRERDSPTLVYHQHYHSVIFTSYDSSLKHYQDFYDGHVIELDGNLRSSSSICNKTIEIYNILDSFGLYDPVDVKKTIDITAKFKSASPFEAMVHNFQDGSDDRQELMKNVLRIIDDTRKEVGEKEKIIVSCVCYPTLINKIQSECKRSGVYFHSPDEMLGCQFSIVILVWEPSALLDIDFPVTVINVMTRCSTNLTIVFNNTLFETIHGMPSVARPDIASFTKYLKKIDVRFEKTLVIYQDEIDPIKFQLRYKQRGYEEATITFLKKIRQRCNQEDDAEHVRDFIRVIDESHKFTSQAKYYENERWLEDEVRRITSCM